ncbi:MAG: zinc ribbon domain-containing protein [Nitrospiraceae bacterium]|nr:zinc ribbon domain-containing protein [Nitrospiraceae bacterium]
MPICRRCGNDLSDESRFCTRCGMPVEAAPRSASIKKAGQAEDGHASEDMNMTVLSVMVAALILAVVFPPWETPPGRPPEFLGFHFILNPPQVGANEGSGIISRLLITIELVTIAVAGLYFSWLFRKKK